MVCFKYREQSVSCVESNTNTILKQQLPAEAQIKMVDVTVFPCNELPGNAVVWRKKQGKKLAMRMGEKRRELIGKFIIRNTNRDERVDLSLCLMERIRPYAEYPMDLNGKREVGFLVGQFFLLIPFSKLKKSVQEKIGGKNYSQSEMFDEIFGASGTDDKDNHDSVESLSSSLECK